MCRCEAVRADHQVGQPLHTSVIGSTVPPQPRAGIEAVVGQQRCTAVGDELDRRQDVVELGLVDEVVEVDPDPAGLDALAARADLAFERT